MTQVPSMFGVEKKSSWRSLDEWSRSVKAKGIFLGGTKETRVMVGNGDIQHFPLLYLFWLSQWLSSCGSILVLKDWCQKTHNRPGNKHFEKIETQILRTSRSIYGRLCIAAYFHIHHCQSDNSSACPGEAVSGAVLNQVGVRLGKRGNNMLIWIDRFVMLNNMDVQNTVFAYSSSFTVWGEANTLTKLWLNIWSWSTVHWVVLL